MSAELLEFIISFSAPFKANLLHFVCKYFIILSNSIMSFFRYESAIFKILNLICLRNYVGITMQYYKILLHLNAIFAFI